MATPLYTDRAELYDKIYSWKDYGSEALRLIEVLDAEGVERGARVLEAACGTGAYLEALAGCYDVHGFDLNPPMLEVARRRVGEEKLFVADMRNVRAEEPFDALVCLFSSIGYLHSRAEIADAARSFFECLRPGGTLVVEPWIPPSNAIDGHMSQHAFKSEDLLLTRASVHRVEGDRSVIDFGWVVTTSAGVETFTERHEMWLVEPSVLIAIFEEVGFIVRWEDEGLMRWRGLLVANKPE